MHLYTEQFYTNQSLAWCVCECVHVLPVCVNVCFQAAKILRIKIHLYGIEHFQSNGKSTVFLLPDLDLHF